jgi:hypothetical protein
MIQLEAVSRRSFNAALFDALEAIAACGGWVKTHQLYSNLMAMIAFEVPADKIETLASMLASVGINIDNPPIHGSSAPDDVAGRLTISFLAEGPDLRRPVPPMG